VAIQIELGKSGNVSPHFLWQKLLECKHSVRRRFRPELA
jgi:hypothetical protein